MFDRREISALTAENYSLERQLLSYQKSISFASNSNQRVNMGQNMGQRAKSDDYLHDSSAHYLTNHQMVHQIHGMSPHSRVSYEDRHSVGSEAQSVYELEFA